MADKRAGKMYELYTEGVPVHEIGERYSLSRQSVNRILNEAGYMLKQEKKKKKGGENGSSSVGSSESFDGDRDAEDRAVQREGACENIEAVQR